MIKISGLQKVIEGNTAVDIGGLMVDAGKIAAMVGPVGGRKIKLLDLLIGKTHPRWGMLTPARENPSAV